MKITAAKSSLHGQVAIPGSKSHTIRAVAIASLAEGNSRIKSPLASGDTQSVVKTYKSLGAEIDNSDPNQWIVKGTAGQIQPVEDTIDVGNSGTTLCIAIGSASLAMPGRDVIFTGDYQIQRRPVEPLANALTNLGAKAHCLKNNGCPPLSVSGRLKGGITSISCPTSQYLTSLLLACPLAGGQSEINVPLLYEQDYAKMTLDWLDRQNIKYEKKDMRWFKIPGGQKYHTFDLPVPADFSSATFFLVAGAVLGQEIRLTGLDFSDSQPDKAVVDYLKAMGADIAVSADSIVTVKGSSLHGVDIDMNRTPDALPAMAVAAAFAKGRTRLLNVPQARRKETDRIDCIAKELGKLGAKIEELPDGMVIDGGKKLTSCALSGYDDHRIVMALAIAGMALDGATTIDTAEAAAVTFPDFVPFMQALGGKLIPG